MSARVLLPNEVVTGHPLGPFPNLFGKVEAEWATDVLVDACRESNTWGPIDFETFDRIARRNHEKLRGNPFYRPAMGVKWLFDRRLIAMPSERVIEISEQLLELIAAHPWTAYALMRRDAHEARCARVALPVSLETVRELYDDHAVELTSATDGAKVAR